MYLPEIKHRGDEDALDDWFNLADTVGLGRMNSRRDVFKVESILADAGDLDFAGTNGPAGYGQYTLDDGVRKYQKRNGLKVDGWLRPDGPTVAKMREQFGARFSGFPTPTQAQIEQHHALAAQGKNGLLVAQLPRIELKKQKSYPPVDPETHGSNTSWVEFLTRNRTNFDGAPEMLATYIKNFGARGVLQARDFVEQWETAKPGEGPDVVAAVLRHLDDSVDRRAFVGGDLPQSPPIGTLRPEVLQARAQATQHRRAKASAIRTSFWRQPGERSSRARAMGCLNLAQSSAVHSQKGGSTKRSRLAKRRRARRRPCRPAARPIRCPAAARSRRPKSSPVIRLHRQFKRCRVSRT